MTAELSRVESIHIMQQFKYVYVRILQIASMSKYNTDAMDYRTITLYDLAHLLIYGYPWYCSNIFSLIISCTQLLYIASFFKTNTYFGTPKIRSFSAIWWIDWYAFCMLMNIFYCSMHQMVEESPTHVYPQCEAMLEIDINIWFIIENYVDCRESTDLTIFVLASSHIHHIIRIEWVIYFIF